MGGGHMMVVDLQGVRTSNGWLLTDPCVLCADTRRFGSGNLGPYAITRCMTSLARRLDEPAVPTGLNSQQQEIVAPENAWKPSAIPKVPLRSPCRGPLPLLDVDSMIGNLVAGRDQKRGALVQLHEGQVRSLCEAARSTLLSQPSLLELDAPINIMGDIHGQFYDLLDFLRLGGAPPTANYLMLGDYVDRGRHSIETICLLLAYKVKYPENFFLLRGNHECASINRIYGFYDECKRRYNIKLWKSFTDCFNCLPIAAVIDEKIFCMHGGLSPDLKTMEQIRRIVRPTDVPDTGLLCDLLWSDPERDIQGWGENDRGVSFTFGPDVVTAFLKRQDLDLVCRAHQVVEDGYEFFAKRQLVTLFSAPNYCGEFDNAGAMMSVDDTLMCSFQILKPTDDE